ncbi:MAG: hypothetical protein Q4C34_09835 [Bacteroidales bacterium]|nr:hypothetical protein [Bacteroidales bacterium]
MNRFYTFAVSVMIATGIGATAQTDTWEPCGEIEITDDIISSVYSKTVAVSSFTAQLERSAETSGLYRVVNPYKNWQSPSDRFVYDSSKDHYLIIHAEDDRKVWFEDFDTGWSDTDENGGPIAATTYVAMYVAHGDDIDFIYEVCPDMFGTADDGLIRFPSQFLLNNDFKPNILVAVGDPDDGFYAGNKQGKLAFRLPSQWQSIGTGNYTDDMMASAYGVPSQTWTVEVERNLIDPKLLRVVSPYAGWNITVDGVTRDENARSYMVIHTEHEPHVWFDDFDTGLRIDGKKITMASDACYFTDKYGYEDTYYETPDIYGQLVDGVMTYAAEYSGEWPCLYLEIGDGDDISTIFGNKNGGFRLTLPDYSGIGSVSADDTDAPVEFYTLQGVKVSGEPAAGIYIRRQGTRVSKIMIR